MGKLTNKQRKRIKKVQKGKKRSAFPSYEVVYPMLVEIWPIRKDDSGLWDFSDRVVMAPMIESGQMYGKVLEMMPGWFVNGFGVLNGSFQIRHQPELVDRRLLQLCAQTWVRTNILPLIQVLEQKHKLAYDVCDIRTIGIDSPMKIQDIPAAMEVWDYSRRYDALQSICDGDWDEGIFQTLYYRNQFSSAMNYVYSPFSIMDRVGNTEGTFHATKEVRAPLPDDQLLFMYEWVHNDIDSFLEWIGIGKAA